MPAEKEKYKTNYDLRKEEYKQQLEQFYTENPDAKVALQQISKSAKTSSADAHTKEVKVRWTKSLLHFGLFHL